MSDVVVAARAWSRAGWAVMAAGGLAALLAPGIATGPARWAPLLLSLLVLGLPHGAVDHHVPDRLDPAPDREAARRRRRLIAAYALAVLAGLGLWVVAPRVALGAFLVVSAAHWGQGDGWWAVTMGGRDRFTSPAGALAWAAARGALPIFGSSLAHPDEARAVAQAIAARFAPGTTVPALAAGPRAAGLAVLAALVVLAALASVQDHRRAGAAGSRSGLRRDLAELAGLVVFFAVVPAAWAIGLYFLAWHAPRHIGRLVSASPEQAALLARGRHLAALRAFHREALPCAAVALAGLAVLAALSAVASADTLVAAALGLIAALTHPHVAVVAWMDRRQGVWH